MLLDGLVECIESLKEKIATHQTSLTKNETRTRTVLVDPLLTFLGWDVANPDRVIVEYDLESERVDYALVGQYGKPSAIVEAKKLKLDLSKHRHQVVNYANIEGIKYAVLTDGNTWELYDVFKQVPWKEKRIMNVSISDMSSSEAALNLLMLWRSNFSSGTVGEVKRPFEYSGEPAKPKPYKKRPTTDWISLTDFDPPSKTSPPKRVRFWDDSEVPIEKWKDLFVQIVKKCYESGKLTAEMLPFGTLKSNYISTSNKHPDGRDMKTFQALSNSPLVIETWMSALDTRNRSKNLLKKCGLDASTVLVKSD